MPYAEKADQARKLVRRIIDENPERNERYLTRRLSNALNEIDDPEVLKYVIGSGEFNFHEMLQQFLADYKDDPESISDEIRAKLMALTDEDGEISISKVYEACNTDLALVKRIIEMERHNALESAIMVMKYRIEAADKLMKKLLPFLKVLTLDDEAALRKIVEENEGLPT